MKVYREWEGIENFEAVGAATLTKRNIIEYGMEDVFNSMLEDIFPDGASEDEINDYLKYESDEIYEMLGIDDGCKETDNWYESDDESDDSDDEYNLD